MATVLGLTGSFGSGKTTAAEMLAEAGAIVIDADRIAREVVRPGSPALAEIAEAFGRDLIDARGELDRPELARRAFATAEGARRLNAIIHPRVRERELELIEAHRNSPLIVLDVPLLYEARMAELCDRVAVVVINEARRFARLRRRGFGEAEVIARLARQWPQTRKAALADFVIDNSGSLDATRNQIDAMLEQLKGVRPTKQ